QGGVTVYQGGQKTRILNVEPIYGAENEFVNFQVACEMAIGVNKLFLSKYAIAITGFAQPIPGHNFKKPYAYYAIANGEDIIFKGFLEASPDDALSVQESFTQQIIKAFKEVLMTF